MSLYALKHIKVQFLYTLTTAPFLFISAGTLSVCEFAMVSGVYILLCPQEEKVHYFSYTLSCTIIKTI